MICTKKPRELKPGDLFVVTNGRDYVPKLEYGDIVFHQAMPMKLLERHPCGALEFLVLPPVKYPPAGDIPACQDIAS